MRSYTMLLATVLAGSAAPAAAQLPSKSVPALIRDERLLIGHYRYVERPDGMKIDVDLNADHTAAYATTIHKSQGSEYPVVVLPLTMQAYTMLGRELIYTAVTRA